MAIPFPQVDTRPHGFAADADGLAGLLNDQDYFDVTEISGTASLAIGADLWVDGPKLVLPGQQRRIEYTGVYRRPQYGSGTRFAFFQPLEVAPPSGDIFGTTTLTFGVGTASLTGSGALAATGVLTFDDGTSVLRGLAAVAGTTALTLGDAAALTGRGALAGSTALLLGASLAPPTIALIAGTATLEFGASLAPTAAATTPEQPSGGYGAQNEYNAARQRKRRRRDDDDESKTSADLPSVAQAGPGSADATPQAPAADLELVRQLVAYWSGEGDREMLNRRAQRALDYALRAQSVLAMQLFERELARQMEDDEMSALLMLLAEDD